MVRLNGGGRLYKNRVIEIIVKYFVVLYKYGVFFLSYTKYFFII